MPGETMMEFGSFVLQVLLPKKTSLKFGLVSGMFKAIQYFVLGTLGPNDTPAGCPSHFLNRTVLVI